MDKVQLRQSKNNPVLVGPAGVGKTAIVEGLAQRIAAARVPRELKGMRLVELSAGGLVASTKYRGQFEERLLGLLSEVKRASAIILFFDELHTLVHAGAAGDSALDAANILKPALARGEIRCIGATTEQEYKQYIASDAALERRFQPLWVSEPSPEDAFQILLGLRPRYQDHHGVEITDDALQAAIRLSLGWLPSRRLPDKAIDLIDEACSRARVPTASGAAESPVGLTVTEQTVAEVLADWVGVEAEALLDH